MADPVSRVRPFARAAVLAVVLGVSAVGLPFASSGAAVPETTVRIEPIDLRSLLRPARGLSMAAGGSLRANRPVRTAPTRRCAPIWFDGIAFTWDQEGRGTVTIRTAVGAAGRLGPAVSLDPEGGPDPGTPDDRSERRGSTYLWTGGARCVRLSLRMPPGTRIADLRAVFVNSSGTAAGPGTGPPDVGPVAVPGTAPLGIPTAEARAPRPRIITREQWGANPKLMNCTPTIAPFLKMGFVHHTAGSNAYSQAQADDVVRGVYAYHTKGRGWCDIGYNFLVDRFGDVFEGRSGGITNDVVGAAQMGFNTGAFSVSVMGNFDVARPPAAALGALERLMAWRLDVAHVNPRASTVMVSAGGSTTRYPRGAEVRLWTISGHRDTGLTACPGRYLYPLIPRIRDVAGRIGLPKIYRPRSSIPSFATDGPVRVRIRATSSGTFRWRVTVLGPDGTPVAELRAPKGARLDVRWTADGTVQPLASGTYRLRIETTGARGGAARPAELELVGEPSVPPSPSPTVTLTPTATPTPTPTT